MPSAVAQAIWTVGSWLGSAGIAQTIAKTAISYALATVVQKQLQRNPSLDDFASEGERRLTTTRASNEPRRIIYGEQRVGGHITYFETHGTDKVYLNMIITLAGHEVEAINNVYWGDTTLTFSGSDGNATNSDLLYPDLNTPLVFVSKNLGSDSQTADGDLTGLGISWDSDNRQRGCPNLYVRLHGHQERLNSIKNITCVVQGKNDIYDPRDLSTGYSTNAALCVANFLADTRYGFGVDFADIDEDSLIAAANVCDESVTLADLSTESRYTINGTFRADQPRGKILQDMVSAMAGQVVYAGGKYYIHAGAYTAPTVTLDDDDLRGGLQIKVLDSVSEAVNRVRGIYANPQADYQIDDFPAVTNATYLSEDNGEEHWRDLELPFTTSYATAQRLAKIELERSRQEITVQFPAMLSGLQVQAGDTVAITNTRMGWSSKVFDVLEVSLAEDNGYVGTDLLLKETASTVYSWANGEETTVDPAPNTDLPDPNTVPAPTSLTVTSGTDELVLKSDGSIISRAHLNWTAPASNFSGRIEVEWKKSIESGNGTINATDQTLTDVSEPFREHMVGKSITVEGAGVAGADLTTTIASFTSKSSVELTDAASTTVSLNNLSGPCFYKRLAPLPAETTDWWIPDLVDGTDYDFRIRSQSVLGRYSSYAEVTDHTLVGKTELPATLAGLSLTAQDHSLLVEWTDSTEADRSRVHIQYDTSISFTDDPKTLSFDWESPAVIPNLRAGLTYYVRGKHVDTSGNVSASWSSSDSGAPLFTQKEIPDFSAYGFIGGTSDFTYKLNFNVTDSAETGTLLIKGNKFISPTDEAVYAKAALYEVDFPNLFPGTGPTPYYLVHLLDDVATDVYPAGTFSTNTTNNIVPALYGYHPASNTWKWYIIDTTGASSELTSGQGYILFARVMVAADGSGDVLEVEPIASQVEKPVEIELEFAKKTDAEAYDFSSVPDGAKVRINGYHTNNDGKAGPKWTWNASSTATADGLCVLNPPTPSTGRLERTLTGQVDVHWAGAKGDGSTNDAAAFQAVADYVIANSSASFYVPNRNFVLNSAITLSGSARMVHGEGDDSLIMVNHNGPAFIHDMDVGDAYYNVYSNLKFQCIYSGTITAACAIEIKGTSTDYYFKYGTFQNLFFQGFQYGIYSSRTRSVTSGEERLDWNLFTGLKCGPYNSNPQKYACYFKNGSGTGNVFSNMNLVTKFGGLYWAADVAMNVGDIVISASQFSTSESAYASIYADSGAGYKERITITACQFDGGDGRPYNLDDYSHCVVAGVAFGGSVSRPILNGSMNVEAIDNDSWKKEFYWNNSAIGTAGNDDVFTAESFKAYSVTMFTVYSFGVVQGKGQAFQESLYRVEKGASTVTVTQISTTTRNTGTATITHSASESSGVVTFNVAINSSAADTNVKTQVSYVGDGEPVITKL